jgi:hypothetical protein
MNWDELQSKCISQKMIIKYAKDETCVAAYRKTEGLPGCPQRLTW